MVLRFTVRQALAARERAGSWRARLVHARPRDFDSEGRVGWRWLAVCGRRPWGRALCRSPADAIATEAPTDHSQHDEFESSGLDLNWNTLRVPFTETMGRVGGGSLTLRGQGSLANLFELSLVGRRWQAFDFTPKPR